MCGRDNKNKTIVDIKCMQKRVPLWEKNFTTPWQSWIMNQKPPWWHLPWKQLQALATFWSHLHKTHTSNFQVLRFFAKPPKKQKKVNAKCFKEWLFKSICWCCALISKNCSVPGSWTRTQQIDVPTMIYQYQKIDKVLLKTLVFEPHFFHPILSNDRCVKQKWSYMLWNVEYRIETCNRRHTTSFFSLLGAAWVPQRSRAVRLSINESQSTVSDVENSKTKIK